jgi:uncharacterized protein (TIGR00255 family)
MNSMTGYGRGSADLGSHTAQFEISSVNKRNLEIYLNLPKEWLDLDAHIQGVLRKSILRGRVTGGLKLSASQDPNAMPEVNLPAVSTTLNQLRSIAEQNDIPFQPDATLLFRILNEYGNSELPEWQQHLKALDVAIDTAVQEFLSMRTKEGEALKKDMETPLDTLSSLLETIEPIVPQQAPTYRQTLLKRLKEAGLSIDLDDERVLREIALYAEKCDVAEELTRLQSHIKQMQETLEEKGLIGRKLEFLLQEIFREFNTLGNKSSNLQLIQAVLEAKAEVEKLREQALNVE